MCSQHVAGDPGGPRQLPRRWL